MVHVSLYSTTDNYGRFHTIFHAILVWCVSHCIIFYTRALWYISHHILHHIGMVRVPLYSTTDNYSGFPHHIGVVCVPLYSASDAYGGLHAIFHAILVWCMSHCIIFYTKALLMVHFTPYSKPYWYGACLTVFYNR